MNFAPSLLLTLSMLFLLSCGSSSSNESNPCNGKNVCLTSGVKTNANKNLFFNLENEFTYFKNALSGGGFNVLGFYLGNWDGSKCIFPVTVFENNDGVQTSYVGAVTIGGGRVQAGSYDCIALKIKNWGSAVTNANAGGVCANWEGQILTNGVTPEDLEGNVINNPTKDTDIYLYFRIGGQTSGNPFIPSEGGILNAESSSISIGESLTTLSFKLVTNSTYSDGSPMNVKDLKEVGSDEKVCTYADDSMGFEVDQE